MILSPPTDCHRHNYFFDNSVVKTLKTDVSGPADTCEGTDKLTAARIRRP